MSATEAAVMAFKTSAPALAGVVERPARVRQMRQAPSTARWLPGLSGSGKSTLAALYARDSGRATLWYRLDSRDDDPAFFYAHFSSACAESMRKGAALPRFSGEDHANEADFGDRYVAALCAGLGKPLLVVFDDAHKIASPARGEMLARFVARATDALELLFVSEETAPPAFFDVIAARRLVLCNDLALAFDEAECAALAIASRVKHVDGNTLSVLTGGHAGALVLACEYLRGAEASVKPADGMLGRIHEHLLSRLVQSMPSARKDLLVRTVFAPQFTQALATELAGADAAAEIEALVRAGLLRRAQTANGETYEAHGLVRQGMRRLLGDGDKALSAQDLAARTVDALLAHGFAEDAFALLVERGNYPRAADVLTMLARAYAQSGQARLLEASLARLPDSVVDVQPWLCFWTGEALLGVDEAAARQWFEKSYAAFERGGDPAGMRLAASSVVTAYGLEYGDIRALDAWLRRYADAGGDAPVVPGCPFEASLCLGVVSAARIRGAFPAAIDPGDIVTRLRRFTEDTQAWHSRDQRVQAAINLVDHARVFQTREQAQIMVLATREIGSDAAGSALQRGRWAISAAYAYFEDAKHELADVYFAQAQALLEQTQSPRLAFDLTMARVDADTKRGDLDAAIERLRALDRIAANAPAGQRAEHARITARVLLLQGHRKEGLRWAGEALKTAELAGFTGSHARVFEIEYVYALAANGDLARAIELSERSLDALQGRAREAPLAVSECLRFLHDGARDAALLTRGLSRAADIGFLNLLGRAPEVLAQVCAHGLMRGIEPDFLRRLIAVNRLSPPNHAGPSWPWPVHVRSLGAFELTIAGAPYRPTHKAQDKPLELLKLLVCCQAMGRASVDKDWIVEKLWPEADEANGRKSLDMALSRLRKLLACEEAVVSQEGRVSLSPQHVWLDIRPLLVALQRVGEHRDARAGGRMALPGAVADVAAVLDHYGGTFLPEGEAPWIIGGREAVTGAVRSALLAADALLDQDSDAQIIPALERALAADPTSEDLARTLMRRHGRRREYGEVIRVYRRLREMLSIVLGVTPSRETEQVKAQFFAEAHADSASAGVALRS